MMHGDRHATCEFNGALIGIEYQIAPQNKAIYNFIYLSSF